MRCFSVILLTAEMGGGGVATQKNRRLPQISNLGLVFSGFFFGFSILANFDWFNGFLISGSQPPPPPNLDFLKLEVIFRSFPVNIVTVVSQHFTAYILCDRKILCSHVSDRMCYVMFY